MTTNKLLKFCELARKASLNSTMAQKLGACVLYNGKCFCLQFNDNIRGYMNKTVIPSVHAEINSLNKFFHVTKIARKNKACILPRKESYREWNKD